MKRLLLILLINLLTFSTTFATEQIPDLLIIGEDTFYLKSFPLEELIYKNKFNTSPFVYGEYSFPHTACYRGYIATWEVVEGNLLLKEVQKLDSIDTQLNITEYLENNCYEFIIKNGYIFADWYSDTLKSYDFFSYNYVYKFDEFYLSKDYLKRDDRNVELIFENGKLIEDNIIPIDAFKVGDKLELTIYYYKNWFAGWKPIQVQGIIRDNNGKKVLFEVQSYGTDIENTIYKVKKEIGSLFWANPRYCRRIE